MIIICIASKASIVQMSLFVAFQSCEILGRIPTEFANEGLLIKMDPSMSFHMMFELEFFVTEITSESSLVRMRSPVLPQLKFRFKCFSAEVARIWFLRKMAALMSNFARNGKKQFSTHFASNVLFPKMTLFVRRQRDFLICHVVAKGAFKVCFFFMARFVALQLTLVEKPFGASGALPPFHAIMTFVVTSKRGSAFCLEITNLAPQGFANRVPRNMLFQYGNGATWFMANFTAKFHFFRVSFQMAL